MQLDQQKNRKLRIAIVGCGHIAQKHINAIADYPKNLELVAICENQPEMLQQAMSQYSVDGYSNYEEMLATSNADIVVLCTPSGLHANQTIKAASYRKHVITEKPMATRWHDGLAMVKACDEAGVHLFVVKQNRFNETLQALKDAIDNDRFNKIYHVNINVYWSRPQSYYDKSRWRGTWEFDGGALMNQASHYVDLLTWLFGPVQNVHAMVATLGRKIEVEDTCVMNIQWRCGAIGSMNVTMLTYPKNFEASITVIGSKGTVKLGGPTANKIEHWEFAEPNPQDETIFQLNDIEPSHSGHSRFYNNVIEVFQGGLHPETDGREGLRSLEVLIAAYLSARDGKTIALPLEY